MAEVLDYLIFVGTYTTDKSEGIYVFRLEDASGKLEQINLAPNVENPSYLEIHPSGKYLYAVNEIEKGLLSSFAINVKTGGIKLLNQQSSLGNAPCHISIDKSGRCALITNYESGNICAYSIGYDGNLSEAKSNIQHYGKSSDPVRQKGPHAHSINIDPNNRFAVVADLGLDQVLVYRLNTTNAKLELNNSPLVQLPGGQGPRHLDFHPSCKYVYLINEIGNSVSALKYDASYGNLSEIQRVSALPHDFGNKNQCADIHVHPSGKFVYGSNRGHNSIFIAGIDQESGRLNALNFQTTGGINPRNFAIEPRGKYLFVANSVSNNIVTFKIDQDSGLLEPNGHFTEVPTPVCIKILAI